MPAEDAVETGAAVGGRSAVGGSVVRRVARGDLLSRGWSTLPGIRDDGGILRVEEDRVLLLMVWTTGRNSC